jgi:hypothetical protein
MNTPATARRSQTIWESLAEPQSVMAIFVVYCLVHLFVRVSLSPNFTLDESEQMLFSQSLQWGYRFRHPPLITWLSWATLTATGTNRAAFFFLKYLLMGLGLAAYFSAARIVIRDTRLAALATFALLSTFVMGWLPNVDLMHTVLLATMLAAYLWADARVLTRGRWLDYILLGVITGLGILSKYIFIVLPIALGIATALTPHFRARLKLAPLLVALLIAVVIVAPYAWWATTHEYSLFALAKTITKSSGPAFDPMGWLHGIWRLVVTLVGFLVPSVLLFPVLYWRACKTLPPDVGDADDRAWLRLYEIAMLVGILIMLASVFVVGSEDFKARWMHQVAMPLFIWFFLRVKLTGASERANKIFAIFALVLALGVVAGRIYVYQTSGKTCRVCREYWPLQSYARAFRSAGFLSGTVVAATYDLGGNLRYAMPEARVVTPGYPDSVFGSPRNGDCLLVWEGKKDMPAELKSYTTDVLRAGLDGVLAQGDVTATLLTTKNRQDTMRYVLLRGSGVCN